MPQKIPNRAVHSNCVGSNNWCPVRIIFQENPLRMKQVAKDITDAPMTASNPITENSMRRISIANIMPPIGDLKMPAIPAAVPHPNIMRVAEGESLNHRAVVLPIAAPEKALGPSAPAEPPSPTVIRHPNNGDKIILLRIR